LSGLQISQVLVTQPFAASESEDENANEHQERRNQQDEDSTSQSLNGGGSCSRNGGVAQGATLRECSRRVA